MARILSGVGAGCAARAFTRGRFARDGFAALEHLTTEIGHFDGSRLSVDVGGETVREKEGEREERSEDKLMKCGREQSFQARAPRGV
jgi:hypothetical protein